ncbi:MAG: DUF4476 domain-containing protein [Flavobacteriales bacterium]
MKLITSMLFTFVSIISMAQSNLTIFNNGGQPFYAILNGIKQNSQPQTNVYISGIKNGGYSLKIIFADGKTPDANKNFFLEEASDITTRIVFKKGVGKIQLVSMVPTAGVVTPGAVVYRPTDAAVYSDAVIQTTTVQTTTTQTNAGQTNIQVPTNGNVQMNVNANGMNQQSTNPNGNVNMNVNTNGMNTTSTGNVGMNVNLNATGTGMNQTQNNQAGNVGMNVNVNGNGMDPNMQNGNVGITINVSGMDPNMQNGNMGVNMNVNGTGMNQQQVNPNANVNMNVNANGMQTQNTYGNNGNVQMNVNANANGMNTQQTNGQTTVTTTTTTTTTSNSTGNVQYNANNQQNQMNTSSNVQSSGSIIACNRTLNNLPTFLEELKDQSFEDDRVEAVKLALKNTCLTTEQAGKIVELYTFDENKLEVAKYLSDRLTDRQNATALAKLMTFDSNKMEYRKYIASH